MHTFEAQSVDSEHCQPALHAGHVDPQSLAPQVAGVVHVPSTQLPETQSEPELHIRAAPHFAQLRQETQQGAHNQTGANDSTAVPPPTSKHCKHSCYNTLR